MILKLIIKEFQDQINTSLGGEATWARITEMAWGMNSHGKTGFEFRRELKAGFSLAVCQVLSRKLFSFTKFK